MPKLSSLQIWREVEGEIIGQRMGRLLSPCSLIKDKTLDITSVPIYLKIKLFFLKRLKCRNGLENKVFAAFLVLGQQGRIAEHLCSLFFFKEP